MGAGRHRGSVRRQLSQASLGSTEDSKASMNPAAIIALVRDAVFLGAFAFIIWWAHHSGENLVKIQDMKAIQSQLADNALRQKQIAQEVSDAQAQYRRDMETVSAAIASHSAEPIRLCVSARPGPVHGISTTTADQPAGSRGADAPARGDSDSTLNVRAAISQFELTYESALADCRQALASWPH